MKKAYLPLSAMLVLGASLTVKASDTDLAAAIANCAAISGDSDRLACFDQLSRKTVSVAVSEPVKKATAEKQKEAFGADTLRAREKSFSKAKVEGEKQPDEMTFTLLEAGKNRAGNYFFIMENGQVWRQLSSDSGKFRVPRKASGVTVKIKKKLFGSHLLTLKGHSIKVKRLK